MNTAIDKTDPRWPFDATKFQDRQLYHMDADSRIQAVRTMDRETLEAALLVPGLQKTVERAIRSRLRKLEAH